MSQVLIRNARFEDLPAITDIYNYYVTDTHITFDLEPCSLENRRDWFEQFAETGPHRILVAELDGQVAGYACSTRLRPKPAYDISVETTIYLAPDMGGSGLGRRLYTALIESLETEEVYRVYGCIALPNPASIALHEKLGFEEVGQFHGVGRKFDRLWDVVWYEKKMKL